MKCTHVCPKVYINIYLYYFGQKQCINYVESNFIYLFQHILIDPQLCRDANCLQSVFISV